MLEFSLSFQYGERLPEVANALRRLGYAPTTGHADRRWWCQGTKQMVPSVANLARAREELSSVASELNGRYDGWGSFGPVTCEPRH